VNIIAEIAVDPRADLAAAIEAAAHAQDAVAAAEDALHRGRQMVVDAEQALGAANALVGHARRRDGAAAAKAVKARAGAATPDATRKARADRDAAEDGLEIARSAIENLEEELHRAKNAAQWALNAVCTARNVLLGNLAVQLLERGRRCRLEAAIAERVLGELLHADDRVPEFGDTLDRIDACKQREEPLQAVKRDAEYFIGAGAIAGDGERARVDESIAAVRGFIAALETDANAEVPDIGVAI
jgi:hypothetical protein